MESRIGQPEGQEEKHRTLLIRGWMIVCGIALIFVLYGLFAFFVIGDKEPPDWDFGAVKDIPGESVYSTYPYRGRTEVPEPQHVNEKPRDATAAVSNRSSSAPAQPKSGPGKLHQESEPQRKSGQNTQQPLQPGTK